MKRLLRLGLLLLLLPFMSPAAEQFANNSSTTLNGSITAGDTSLTVNSNSSFPASAQYRIVIDSEIMIVTAGAGTNTWTVTRGAESTTGAAHSNGASVYGILTAGALDQLKTDLDSTTSTYTNKTLDAEATGNNITLPLLAIYRAGVCQAGTASLGFSTPTSGGPTAACVTGTNTNYAVAQFTDDGTTVISIQDHFYLPADWTAASAIDLVGRWRSTATSGNVKWQIQTTCVADGATGDPAFNTASTVTDATKGTANQHNDFTITGITITGCAASKEFFWKLLRDPGDAADTLSATAELISLVFTYRRTL